MPATAKPKAVVKVESKTVLTIPLPVAAIIAAPNKPVIDANTGICQLEGRLLIIS